MLKISQCAEKVFVSFNGCQSDSCISLWSHYYSNSMIRIQVPNLLTLQMHFLHPWPRQSGAEAPALASLTLIPVVSDVRNKWTSHVQSSQLWVPRTTRRDVINWCCSIQLYSRLLSKTTGELAKRYADEQIRSRSALKSGLVLNTRGWCTHNGNVWITQFAFVIMSS